MPIRKLSDDAAKRMVGLKERCPCITNADLAYAFKMSQSRVGEIIRAAEHKRKDKIAHKAMNHQFCKPKGDK